MANIELVIKISEESYNNLKMGCTQRVSDGEMIEALKNGIPLPKGHGRLIDENAITYNDGVYEDGTAYTIIYPYNIENAQTIIEADKSKSEE